MIWKIIWSCFGIIGLWECCYYGIKWWNHRHTIREKTVYLPLEENAKNLEVLIQDILLEEGGDFPIYLVDLGAGEEIRQTALLLQHDFPQLFWMDREQSISEEIKNLCLKSDTKYSILTTVARKAKKRNEYHGAEGTDHVGRQRG